MIWKKILWKSCTYKILFLQIVTVIILLIHDQDTFNDGFWCNLSKWICSNRIHFSPSQFNLCNTKFKTKSWKTHKTVACMSKFKNESDVNQPYYTSLQSDVIIGFKLWREWIKTMIEEYIEWWMKTNILRPWTRQALSSSSAELPVQNVSIIPPVHVSYMQFSPISALQFSMYFYCILWNKFPNK